MLSKNNNVKLKHKNGFKVAGRQENVLINMLIGANSSDERKQCLDKIMRIENNEVEPDIISDLSTIKFSNKQPIWKYIVEETSYVAATLPIYTVSDKKNFDERELIEIIHEQLEGGVGLITIHPTASRELLDKVKNRITPITSRGGNIIANDMISNNRDENLYLKILDDIIDLCNKFSCAISIGTTFRSSNIIDAYDEAHILELKQQILLANYISKRNIGVIIEAPGHANPSKIDLICEILNQCQYPIMPLGPIVTDVGIGMDHITSSIGATIMGIKGCVQVISAVTKEEHTGNIPSIDSVIEAINTARLTAHIIDMEIKKDFSIDEMIALDRQSSCIYNSTKIGCTRCGELCPLIKN